MNLLGRINLAFLAAFAIGGTVSGVVAHKILQENAKREGLATARLMMASALASRYYTSTEIVPLLQTELQHSFPSQSVPSYAATQNMERLRQDRPEYTYKEATLNPTNPRDRASDWEADIVNQFRNDKELKELSGERMTAVGPALYLARPLKIADPNCLRCHSTPQAAPTVMLAKYGEANGFGWQLNETVGSQIVSVPLAAALDQANHTFIVFIGSLLGVFALVFVLINVMVRAIVLRPIARLAALSEQVSRGDVSGTAFEGTGTDEISQLGRSFERMRRSLEKSLSLLQS